MTTKAAFNAEEWQKLVSAPALAGLYVAAAARGGTLRESISMARAYKEARKEHHSELLQELLSSPPALDPNSMPRSPEEVRALALDSLREALGRLEGRVTPDELEDYRTFVREVAAEVARAHKEGGFLGVGGEEVSEQEQAALDAIEQILAEPAP